MDSSSEPDRRAPPPVPIQPHPNQQPVVLAMAADGWGSPESFGLSFIHMREKAQGKLEIRRI